MLQRRKSLTGWRIWRNVIASLTNLVLCTTIAAQQRPAAVSDSDAVLLAPEAPQAQSSRFTAPQKIRDTERIAIESRAIRKGSASEFVEVRPGVRRITLEQVQDRAAAAQDPMAHLAELQVEAARQHRLEAQTDYFPKISSTLMNFHFNKFMGLLLTIHPATGGTATAGLPLLGEDQTLVAVTAAQPITPLFKVRQVVNLARADEAVARAKAGTPVMSALNVEEMYYRLLVAQRQLVVAKAGAEELRTLRLVAASSTPTASARADEDLIEAGDALAIATAKVGELTSALDELIGLPLDTQLELVPPKMRLEDISLKEATDRAMSANPEIVEAEQNVVKARAAATLSKLEYVPDVIVIGGYTYQNNAVPLLPRDFSFIGLMGSYNLFDFGKREHAVKERNAQLAMAHTALEIAKSKVAAAVRSSYFAVQRLREVSELRHQLISATELRRTTFNEDDGDLQSSRSEAEAAMFQADLNYRQSLAGLWTLMGMK